MQTCLSDETGSSQASNNPRQRRDENAYRIIFMIFLDYLLNAPSLLYTADEHDVVIAFVLAD